MNGIIDEIRAMNPDFTPRRLSDHSLIMTTLRLWTPAFNPLAAGEQGQGDNMTRMKAGTPKPTKFKVNGVKEGFMSSSVNAKELARMIDDLLSVRAEQEAIDQWYERFVHVFHEEMLLFYKQYDNTPKSRNNIRVARKAWWNDNLDVLAKQAHLAEKKLVAARKAHRNCAFLKAQFLSCQSRFDKAVK